MWAFGIFLREDGDAFQVIGFDPVTVNSPSPTPSMSHRGIFIKTHHLSCHPHLSLVDHLCHAFSVFVIHTRGHAGSVSLHAHIPGDIASFTAQHGAEGAVLTTTSQCDLAL